LSALAPALVARRLGRTSLATDAGLVLGGSLVIAGLAQVSLRLPGTPVPVTLQTLGVLLIAAALGARRAAAAVIAYLAEGAAGLPVFAEAKGGAAFLVAADPLHTTGGYLWGFVVAGFVLGALCDRGWDRSALGAVAALVAADALIFALGVPWLAGALHIPMPEAVALGLYPFVLGEAAKVAVAAGALRAAWGLARRRGITPPPAASPPRGAA
jgi:biotin transport system substrate-specific component